LRKLSFGFSESGEERDMKQRLQVLEREIEVVQKKKEELKQLHIDLYDEEIIALPV
jgi:hypothetical protein